MTEANELIAVLLQSGFGWYPLSTKLGEGFFQTKSRKRNWHNAYIANARMGKPQVPSGLYRIDTVAPTFQNEWGWVIHFRKS